MSEYINDEALDANGLLSMNMNNGLCHMLGSVAKEDMNGKCC